MPPNYSPHRLCPHVLAHGSRHINHFQRSPHSTHTLLTPTTDHTALSALPARAKSPLHVQPLVVPIYLSSCSSKMFAKIHLRFATASYPAPGQQHAPKCDFPNSATLMCEPRSGPISPSIHSDLVQSRRMVETRPRYQHAAVMPFTPSIHAFPFEKDHVASDRSG